jgi:uncharacterized protein (DUF433 family)
MTATAWPFIAVDDLGRPIIQSKGMKVLQLVSEHLAFDWDAEQLRRQHPHLALSEIHAALGYYHEHRAECDELLEREEQELCELRRTLEDPVLQERLRRAKRRI